jgi:hypothetical protein
MQRTPVAMCTQVQPGDSQEDLGRRLLDQLHAKGGFDAWLTCQQRAPVAPTRDLP